MFLENWDRGMLTNTVGFLRKWRSWTTLGPRLLLHTQEYGHRHRHVHIAPHGHEWLYPPGYVCLYVDNNMDTDTSTSTTTCLYLLNMYVNFYTYMNMTPACTLTTTSASKQTWTKHLCLYPQGLLTWTHSRTPTSAWIWTWTRTCTRTGSVIPTSLQT